MKHRARAGLSSVRDDRKWRKMKRAQGSISQSMDGKEKTDGFFLAYLLLLAAGCGYLVQMLLRMNGYAAAVAGVFLLGYAFSAVKQTGEQKRQETRLSEASIYMDTILYAFLKEGKVDTALSDALFALSDGEMKEKVREASLHVRSTFDDSEVLRDGLKMIEDAYPSRRLAAIHTFMLHVEDYGGEYKKPAMLLLKDKELWEKRIRVSIAERKKMFRDVVLSVITSIIICGMVQYIPVMEKKISDNPFIQLGSLFVLAVDLVILYRAQRYLSADWLQYDKNRDEAEYEQKMLRFRSYDRKRARIPSIVTGSIALAGSVVLIFHDRHAEAAFAVAASMVLFGQHRIGQSLLSRQLKEEVKRAFPGWLLDLVLLLQSENVQMALQKSLFTVPGVLRADLNELLERLRVSPEDAAPYHRFLQEFEIPEIQSAMSMLYSLSAGHGGDATQQIEELVNRSQEMLSEAEKQKNADRNAGLYLLFLAPVITASVKMLIDLSVLMLAFLMTQTVTG